MSQMPWMKTLLCAAIVFGTTASAAQPAPPASSSTAAGARHKPVHRVSDKELRKKIRSTLQAMGDLSIYMAMRFDGPVIAHFCGEQPQPTLVGKPLQDEKFEQAVQILAAANKDLQSGREIKIGLDNAACNP